MMMMRRLKSIASGRSSISDLDGDAGSKRAKFDQDAHGEVPAEPDTGELKAMDVDLNTEPTDLDIDASDLTGRTEHGGIDQLPKEMHEMTIRDDKAHHQIDKVVETTILKGNGTETRPDNCNHNWWPKWAAKADYLVHGRTCCWHWFIWCGLSGEPIAIKKVLQDKRYKNRELQVMHLLDHPNVVQLRHYFFSTTEKNEVYLNLVLEYVPETVHRVIKYYTRMNQDMPLFSVQLYTYQISRALGYIHGVIGLCHRDIKPQNLLVNPKTHQVKLCDFGTAKMLVPGEPNISYIYSRYYRAPELIFGDTEYTTAIDMWSAGCVLAELLLGQDSNHKFLKSALCADTFSGLTEMSLTELI